VRAAATSYSPKTEPFGIPVRSVWKLGFHREFDEEGNQKRAADGETPPHHGPLAGYEAATSPGRRPVEREPQAKLDSARNPARATGGSVHAFQFTGLAQTDRAVVETHRDTLALAGPGKGYDSDFFTG
jgi:hypothetical protein